MAYFDTELKINDSLKPMIHNLTKAIYSKKNNPLVKRSAGARKIKTMTRLSETLVANLLRSNEEIIVDFYHSHTPNNKAYQKALEYLVHIDFIEIYKAPGRKDFYSLPIEKRANHLIAGGKRRKSSIILTDRGRKKLSSLNPKSSNKQIDLFDDCIRLQEKTSKTNTKTYAIAKDQRKGLLQRYNDLLAYRGQVQKYNASYFDDGCGVRLPLNDLPRMIFSYREGHNFDRHGRVTYLANRIKTEYRPSIQFNGMSTVELDFKCSLPSILLQSAGVTKNDFYSFKGFSEAYRPMFKKITVTIIGAKEENTVKKALLYKLNMQWCNMENGRPYDQFWISGKSKDQVKADIEICSDTAIRAYKSIPDVREKIFRGKDQISLELQYTESLIGWEIINEFVRLQKPIFSVHDSFVVLKQDQDLLHDLMIRAYQKHVGVDPLPIDLPE